jgi:large subunit ribosomal protein L13
MQKAKIIEIKKTVTKKIKKQPIVKKWFLIDAKDQVLGRLSSNIATILLGKNKVSYLPYLDSGDYVLVINAAKVAATGRKEEEKNYYRYSGYPGGLRTESLKTLRGRKPEMIIEHAVIGMLPKTKLGKALLKKLYIYSGDKHPHEAQKVEELTFER